MSDPREKGKGLFGRLLAGSQPAPDRDAKPDTPAAEAAPQSVGWFQRLKSGLGKTSSKLTTGITDLISKRKLDAATLDDLEDLLIQSDLGIATTGRITDAIAKGRFEKGISAEMFGRFSRPKSSACWHLSRSHSSSTR